MKIRPLADSDRPWVNEVVADHFGSARIISRGVFHDCQALPGLIAVHGSAPCGVLIYSIREVDCEVVALVSLARQKGVAVALLGAAAEIAREAACRRLWLVTTNDNQAAIEFYTNRGWFLKAIHENAVAEARRLKPEIPECGQNGVPIRDEWEFELFLSGSGA